MRARIASAALFSVIVAAWVTMRPAAQVQAQNSEIPNTGMADPSTLAYLHSQWRAAQPANAQAVNLALLNIAGLSSESANASGQVRVNPATGAVQSRVNGLPEGAWELWLIDNGSGRGNSTLPDDEDRMILAGSYAPGPQGSWTLETAIESRPAGFEFDRAAVVRQGQNPSGGFVLFGGANLYERLARGYVRESNLDTLVARGRALFSGETFQGNGRFCGTCHAESNNFTIDAEFIKRLPASDPLFVHERTPALRQNFENPGFLRQFGLVIANADGFDNLQRKFTLRGVPSLQSIGTQITAPEPVFFVDFTANGQAPDTPERLGWGNDALPLRDFAIGAILQHMPKTLARKPGSDFRLPTDDELDALAAYQLSIGRQEDFDLTKLRLLSPQAVRGQRLYMDTGMIGEPGHKNCNACHFNAGGTAAFGFNDQAPGFSPKLDANPRGFNGTFGTNVNGLSLARELGLTRDSGFGSVPLPTGGFGNLGFFPGIGEIPLEEFNSGSVVESADTGPFFHNNTVATLEESIAFYGTKAYQAPESIGDPVAGPLPVKISSDPNDPEVQDIASFLRVLNALENVRSAISVADRALRVRDLGDVKDLAALGREEANDGFEVLTTGSLGRNADLTVVFARTRLAGARASLDAARTAGSRAAADEAMRAALGLLRSAREALADVSTLPASFRR